MSTEPVSKAAFTKADQARERGNAELLKAATLEGIEDDLENLYDSIKENAAHLKALLADLGRVVD